jgi:hypothetical protein
VVCTLPLHLKCRGVLSGGWATISEMSMMSNIVIIIIIIIIIN